jgi:hypothetical protein
VLILCPAALPKKFMISKSFLVELEWPYSRAKTTTNAGKDVVKQEPLYTAGGNSN